MDGWMIWVGAGLLCMIIEIFTPGFLFMSFGIGAILTGMFSIFITDVTFQILLFAVITFIVFINLRRFSKRLISSVKETNVFALVGKTGIVTKEIQENGRGYVKVGGEDWSAISDSNKTINEGTRIKVINIDGNKLMVSEIITGEE
ncbi:MAG: NfeD family protein [Candidatus Cloacimonetes bacterium]|nr:NfeD family protein [Candidatus Cloacimonadota bacterium]